MCSDGAFQFRAQSFGNITVALPPDRGLPSARRADYHDPALPPRHALLAFGLWLQHVHKVSAVVHMGAHGTLEWLPGKAVALTAACFPEAVLGALPVFYPFIVSNPGEAAQAKRRIAGVTIGHLPPPLVAAELSGAARDLERLVDEYAQADGLDPRRRQRLASLIAETAQRNGLAGEAGIDRGRRPRRSPANASMRGCVISRTSPSRTACTFMDAAARSPERRSSPSPCKGEGRGGGPGIRRDPHPDRFAFRPPPARGVKRAPRQTVPSPNAPHSLPPSTAAASRPGRPARRRAGGAMCCRPGAISTPPIPACCRPRPPWIWAHWRPTR